MKRIIIIAIEILICFIIQSSMFPYISLANIMPNLLVILVVSYGYIKGKNSGLLVGFFSGLLVDLTFGNLIGLHSLLYMIVGYLAGFSHLIYDDEDFTLPIIFVAIGDFIFNFLYYMTSFLLKGRLNLGFYLRRIIIPGVIYTVVVSVLLYKIIHTIDKLLDKDLEEEV